jgi:hypothetical protein
MVPTDGSVRDSAVARSPRGRHRLIGGTLVIKSAHPEDQGRYLCSVNNSLALAEVRTEFTVRDKLQRRLELVVQVVCQLVLVVDANKEVLVTCSWTGHPRYLTSI